MIFTIINSLFQIQDASSKDNIAIDLGNLYEPEEVYFSFDTIGWTLLIYLAFALTILFILISLRSWRKNKYRRIALKQLNYFASKDELEGVFILLKRTAIEVYGREKAAHLTQIEWLNFLDQTAIHTNFQKQEIIISKYLFQKEEIDKTELNGIINNAKIWIKSHAV